MAVVCAVLGALGSTSCDRDDGAYLIGVSLPVSGELEEAARELLQGIEMLVDDVNAAGGIDDRPLRLVVEDDGNTPEGAARVAASLASDTRVLGVIGHFYSSVALGATEVYDRERLVNIVPVANDPRVTRRSDWVFGMLPPTDAEGRFMAAYLDEVLDIRRVAIVSETATYGAGLAEAFLEEAERLGLEIVDAIRFDPAGPPPERVVLGPEAQAVLILSQAGDGKAILAQLREDGVAVPVLVPSAFVEDPSLPAFHRPFEGPLYAVTPFLYQTANIQATRFEQAYISRYEAQPGIGAPMAYDAARLLATAIREAGPDRGAIRDHLARHQGERALDSVTGVLSMDAAGAIDRPLYVTEVDEGYFKVAFTQLLPTEGRLQRVDVAYVGIDHFRVETIDPTRFSFNLELFMWVKWRSESLDTDDIVIINAIYGIDDEQYVLVEDLSGSVRYRAYRIKSTFLTPFDLQRFPFDEQTLALQVAHRTRDSTELLLVPDVGHFRTDPVRLYDPEWRYLDQAVYSELYRYPSNFGNPEAMDRLESPYFSSVNVNMTVARSALPHLLTALLPLVLILMLTVTVLWLGRVEIAVRLGIGMTSLLAILVFHMTQAASLPNVGYLMKIDLYFVLSYIWIFLLFLMIIGVYLLHQYRHEKLGLLLNRVGPPLILLAAFGSFAWVTWGW